MEEEHFIISIIATIIGVLPILILSIIICERKKTSKSSHRKPSSKSVKEEASGGSSHQHHRNETSTTTITRPSASYECTECQRFDEEIDGALKAKTGIKIVNKDGRCCINEHEISPKKCEHGIGENVITINKPELQMSTFVGNGVVMEINKRKFTIKRTNMGKVTTINNCNINFGIIIINGKISSGGTNNNCNVGHTIDNNYSSPECLECSKYDEQIAETTKATIIRDRSGKMIIVSSARMDIVNQNGRIFINDNKIKSKTCQHSDINCCSIFYSSNIKGIKNSSISNSKNINAKKCRIDDSSKITGTDCNISDSKDVNGKRCNISDCKNVTGNGCTINDCKGVIGRNSTINDCSSVDAENCTIDDCSNVTAQNCKINDSSNVTAKESTINDCSGVIAENCTIYDSTIIKKINCVCYDC